MKYDRCLLQWVTNFYKGSEDEELDGVESVACKKIRASNSLSSLSMYRMAITSPLLIAL